MGRRSMSSKAILSRVKRLENVFAVESGDDWIDILMWSGSQGGIFGHAHCCVSCSGRETVWRPCSDEEEVAIMRRYYEDEGHKLFGKGAEVSFVEYLERFSYLGSEELADRRKAIIDRFRGEENGARTSDSSG
jgi:hypothetical protein